MAYNSSSARVLVPQDYQPAKTPQKPGQQVRLKVVKRKSQSLAFVNLRNICMFAAVIACICVIITNQVQLNELNREIYSVNAEITELESEYVKMQSSLESTLSIRNVTKRAEQELGMQRMDQFQVVHVRIYEDDKVEILNDAKPEGFSEEIELVAANIVGYIKGFFREE